VPYVLTVDQVASRGREDLVEHMLSELASATTLLPFVRTVGDEFQGLLDDPLSVVDVILGLMRTGHPVAGPADQQDRPGHDGRWHIGLGIGPVETPLPADSRSARGAAFLAARTAVERAKASAEPACVEAAGPAHTEAEDAEVVIRLLAAVRDRRTAQGWEARDLAAQGLTQAEVAGLLGVSRQAVSQRLAAAGWALERDTRPVLARLLARTEARSLG
jgi:hypothetical protein